MSLKQRSVLPGFGLTMGCTLSYLSLLVLIPLAGLFLKSASIGWMDFWSTVTDSAAIDAYKLSFGASLAAAAVNAVFGLVVAWTLVRYSFVGKKFVDAVVDLPFAMPTAVSGIALSLLYSKEGWIGRWLDRYGIEATNNRLGVMVALTFIGLPFVVRTLQPALEDMDMEVEEAAASLGATRWQTLRHVILPTILPALLTGFALAFARGLGEYGSVIFMTNSDHQVIPMLIVSKLGLTELGSEGEAAAIAVVTLGASFVILLFINVMQWWSRRYAA
jgi:sulfate/thiosulfate transport system permease protein